MRMYALFYHRINIPMELRLCMGILKLRIYTCIRTYVSGTDFLQACAYIRAVNRTLCAQSTYVLCKSKTVFADRKRPVASYNFVVPPCTLYVNISLDLAQQTRSICSEGFFKIFMIVAALCSIMYNASFVGQ